MTKENVTNKINSAYNQLYFPMTLPLLIISFHQLYFFPLILVKKQIKLINELLTILALFGPMQVIAVSKT